MTTYAGPDRRLIPRKHEGWDVSVPVTTRIIQKLDVIKRLLLGGYLEEERKPPFAPHDGTGA